MSPDVLLDILPKTIALFVPAAAAFFCLRMMIRVRGSAALAALMTALMSMVALAGIAPWALGPEPAPIPALVLALISVAYAGPLCRGKSRHYQRRRATSQPRMAPLANAYMTDLQTAPPAPVAAHAVQEDAPAPRRRLMSKPIIARRRPPSEPVFRHNPVSRPLSRPLSRPTEGGEIPKDVLLEAERLRYLNKRPVSVRHWAENHADPALA